MEAPERAPYRSPASTMVARAHSPRLPAADGEEVVSAARRFFDSGLCCAVEVEHQDGGGHRGDRWEPRMLVFASADPEEALAAVQDTLALMPGTRVRVAAYEPVGLYRVPLPYALVCSPPQAPAVMQARPRRAARHS